MKRVFSVLMICALLMAGLAVFASAEAASITIAADKTAATAGETVTADIQLNGYTANSWSAMTILVTYDADTLTYVEAVSMLSGEYVTMETENTAGKVLISWVGDQLPAPGEGNVVAKVSFTVKDVAQATDIQLGASFVPSGMAAEGTTEQLPNTDDSAYTSGTVQSEAIEIQPAQPDATEATVTTTEEPDNTASIKVKGEYVKGKRIDSYKIIISWEDMTYSYADGLEWDPSTHKWVLAETGEGWGTIDAKDITIINHSNNSVKATASYEATVDGTGFTWSTESVTVDGAEGYTVEEPPKGTISATFVPGTAVITDLENPNPMGIIKITIE